MPSKPQKPCKTPGCPKLSRETFCGDCLAKGKGRETRDNSYQRGYNKEWQGYRSWFLSRNRWCVDPEKVHLIPVPAVIVDHKIPHRGDVILFWDRSNHQALCKSCHDFKTATRDGGFGRVREKSIP